MTEPGEVQQSPHDVLSTTVAAAAAELGALAAAGEGPQQPAEGTEGDQERLSPEERRRMCLELQQNCSDTQQLLARLVEQERQLREDTAGFILRDVEEENARIALARVVADDQRARLRDTAYVKWARANGKGEFADDAAEEEDARALLLALPSALRPAVVRPLLGPVVAALAGWRGASTESDAALDAVVADVPPGHVLVLNGVVAWDACPEAAAEAAHVVASPLSTKAAKAATVEERYVLWRRWLCDRSAAADPRTALQESPSAKAALRDDGTDVAAWVPAAALGAGVVARGCIVQGALRCVEVCPHHIDVMTPLGIDAAAVTQAFAPVAAAVADAPGPVAVTAVVGPDGAAVVDAALLTPDVVFDGFSWTELCSHIRADPAEPVVRAARHRLLELPPHDAVTERWFPFLNGTAPIPVTGHGSRMALLGVAVAAAAIGAGAATLLARRR